MKMFQRHSNVLLKSDWCITTNWTFSVEFTGCVHFTHHARSPLDQSTITCANHREKSERSLIPGHIGPRVGHGLPEGLCNPFSVAMGIKCDLGLMQHLVQIHIHKWKKQHKTKMNLNNLSQWWFRYWCFHDGFSTFLYIFFWFSILLNICCRSQRVAYFFVQPRHILENNERKEKEPF